ncbi:MAG: pantetheine-phosphate adenylyltransferase [Candidatus Gygaella obscura]|nr:pantetheine-phosphate adenylyltransferase [Candidatus Gygaella obscura]
MNKKAIYPGTFDPLTYGHLDIIKRGLRVFDEIIVGVAHNPQKNPLFSLTERMEMVKKATRSLKKVKVDSFEGLVIKYARRKRINVIMRGVRMVSDFDYEFQMALTNRKLASDIETIFLMPSEEYSYVSSKLLKEASFLGADISDFVPAYIVSKLKDKFRKEKFII